MRSEGRAAGSRRGASRFGQQRRVPHGDRIQATSSWLATTTCSCFLNRLRNRRCSTGEMEKGGEAKGSRVTSKTLASMLDAYKESCGVCEVSSIKRALGSRGHLLRHRTPHPWRHQDLLISRH